MTWKQYQSLYFLIEGAERYASQHGQAEIAKLLDEALKLTHDLAKPLAPGIT